MYAFRGAFTQDGIRKDYARSFKISRAHLTKAVTTTTTSTIIKEFRNKEWKRKKKRKKRRKKKKTFSIKVSVQTKEKGVKIALQSVRSNRTEAKVGRSSSSSSSRSVSESKS